MADTTYEVRVAGLVPAELMQELGEVTVTEQETRTVLTGRFADQAALHGFLRRLRALDLQLVELREVPAPDDDSPQEPT